MSKKIVLGIDFNNNVIGSYYGEKLENSKGINVNAVKGFFYRLKSFKDMFNPDYIVIANDLSRERTFRRKLYAPYKAQRKPMDPDIIRQINYAKQMTALLGYPFINNDLYEADDILGMLAKFVNERDMQIIITSSDRDLYQLVNDNTFIFSPKGKDLIDRAYMYENYKLTPEQWIEYKMLQGDTSDNIPGIPGVGKVTALKLMQEFGSIDEIYKHLGSLKPGLRNVLENGKEILSITRDLVTIVTDYTKIGLTESMIERQDIFVDEIYQMIEELEIPSLFNIMNYSLFKGKEGNAYEMGN